MTQTGSRARIASFAVLAVALAGALGGCSGAPRGGFSMPPMPVEAVDVKSTTVRDRFRALGTIQAEENVQVVSELNAVVRELPFAEGQSVAKGALLARLDDSEIGADARRAEALRDQARTNFARMQQLAEQKAASPQELDDASSALKVAEANYGVAKARFDKTRILSPLAGVVGRRLVSPGAFLRTGDPITEVAAVDRMKVSFSAPERYADLLRRGAAIDVTTSATGGRVFRGQLSVVDPILDPVTRTVQLVARVTNPGRVLRPGMSADVTATLAERPNALVVPDEAVFAEGDQSFVYRIQPDSTVMRQAVVVGLRDSAQVEITQGLSAGDRVVSAGYQKLFPGAKVMPVPSGALGAGGPGGPGGAPGSGADAKGGAAAPGGKSPAAGAKTSAGKKAGGK
jgi:membrane fusion protein (multidrug efflux system)